ncbi:uncharacterized protein [Gossypium hirsutum]|uniref:Uncharacterized protein n=1 Tax=Gossypium hirsutum TaxID=3635 RepID=A0ABM3BHL8_GOSHI|nr:uncharacterized protein LOC121227687 [Gossypium hirsutum]
MFGGPVRAGDPVASVRPQPCAECGRSHLDECWKKIRACFRCGFIKHEVRNCPQRPTLTQAAGQGHVQSMRGGQTMRGRGQVRGGNGFGRERGAPGRGTGNTEARQSALVHAVRCREDGDAPDVITSMFLIYNLPYVALIDIGSTHSYVACAVSGKLGIQSDSTAREMTV